MSADRLRKYAGWAALAAGSIEILGLVVLILFFTLELPQASASSLRFGYLSDVTPIIIVPVKLIAIVTIFLLQQKHAPRLSTGAVILGIAGILLTAWTNIMFVSEEISLEQQIQLFYASLAFWGPWHILVNSLPGHEGSLPSRLTMLGILVGIGQLIMYAGSLLLSGYDDLPSLSPAAVVTNIPLLISLLIGVPMVLIGYSGTPIWLVWLGQTLLRRDTQSALNRLKALH
jgi:hypothetical protein